MTSVHGQKFFFGRTEWENGGYRELQKELDRELVRLAGLPALQGPKIDRLIDKLRQNRFNLVVLGAFKRGKSTLINALLGKPVLPTAIVHSLRL